MFAELLINLSLRIGWTTAAFVDRQKFTQMLVLRILDFAPLLLKILFEHKLQMYAYLFIAKYIYCWTYTYITKETQKMRKVWHKNKNKSKANI